MASQSGHLLAINDMLRAFANLLAYVALYAVFLFVPAGTVRWPAAWVLLSVLIAARTISVLLLYRSHRALILERARLPLQRKQASIDKLLLPAYMASVAALVAFVAWDCWHARLLGTPAAPLRAVGLVLFASAWLVVHRALRSNPFAVVVVRYQAERGHDVVTTGPYRVVRHPMYAGLLLGDIGLALWLGSTAGVVASVVPAAVLMLRIVAEERLLAGSLAGYARYATEVRWRLVPWLW